MAQFRPSALTGQAAEVEAYKRQYSFIGKLTLILSPQTGKDHDADLNNITFRKLGPLNKKNIPQEFNKMSEITNDIIPKIMTQLLTNVKRYPDY
ncbi:MAG: hypothetical protein WDM90_07850 [Ferruginibacter sp.]